MTDYSNALSGQEQPLETLRARVSSIKRSDKKMLAWIHAVAEASEAHAHQLQSIFAKYAVSERDLGTLGAPWDAIASVALANANASATSARRLRSEVEQPMRAVSRTYDESTAAVASDASYSPSSAQEVQNADLEWAAAVREALLRMQTLFVDSTQEVQRAAEKASVVLLNFNPSDEPDSFVAQIVSGVAPIEEKGHSRAASQQTFVHRHHQNATRKASRMSLPESHNSEKKRTGLRSKVGSIFRPKSKQDKFAPMRLQDEFSETSSRASERMSRHGRAETPTAPSSGLGRTGSLRRPQQPTATQPPDFGLQARDLRNPEPSMGADGPLHMGGATGSAGVGASLGAGAIGGATEIATAPSGILQPTPRHSAQNVPTVQDTFDAPDTFNAANTFNAPQSSNAPPPAAPSADYPAAQDLPSVPPPRGGRKINSMYFAGAPSAHRESVVDIPENRPLASTSQTSLGRTNSLRQHPLKRDITGQQAQAHPALPIVDGPAASVVESLTLACRQGQLEDVLITGDIKFAFNKPAKLRVVNERHLTSFVPEGNLVASEEGIYSYNPQGHIPGATIAKYSGSFPALVPLMVTPQWQVLNNQTRLIVNYQLAPDYALETALLSNLVIAVSVSGGVAQSAHAKPLATFSKEKQRVTWRFNQPVQVSKATPERLVCQFITEGPAHEAKDGIEVRFEIQNAPTAIGLQAFGEAGWESVKTAATAYTERYIITSEKQ